MNPLIISHIFVTVIVFAVALAIIMINGWRSFTGILLTVTFAVFGTILAVRTPSLDDPLSGNRIAEIQKEVSHYPRMAPKAREIAVDGIITVQEYGEFASDLTRLKKYGEDILIEDLASFPEEQALDATRE